MMNHVQRCTYADREKYGQQRNAYWLPDGPGSLGTASGTIDQAMKPTG
jgi:hypothetical protein